jgi:hypothetical protein
MGEVFIHKSVKNRWDTDKNYRPENLEQYIKAIGWPAGV